MTPQETIEFIEQKKCRNCKYFNMNKMNNEYRSYCELLNLYTYGYNVCKHHEFINKNTPYKPIGDLHSVPHYRCPNCNREVKLYCDSPIYSHCKYCEQLLDWSRDE